ncbi:MAG: RsmB/NOP family class I SAM-dependent RNA methyltransferase [Alphaproteobacteria bacterium]
MTPAARIAAVITLLDDVALGRQPADQALAAYVRRRRYIGAKDRRAIADTLFAILRALTATDFRLGQAEKSGRLRAARWLVDGGADLDALFSGGGYAPAPLTAAERAALDQPPTALPDWAAANLPEWLVPAFRRRFGDDWPQQAAALNAPAPVDLRVNRLKATRDQARGALAEAGIVAQPTPFSPDGLRLEARFVPGSLAAFAEGWVEPQDEASQLVATVAGAQPGMTVVDLCAGAGGKTLALAAAMDNRGRLVACDTDGRRLARLAPRADRAGVRIIDQIIVNDDDTTPPGLAGVADRVLVDAPCSGTGTWRRQPDARLRIEAETLERLGRVQDRLIRRAALLCKPGGIVVYAVCSVLLEEGPERIASASTADPRLQPVPPAELAAGIPPLPAACLADERGLSLGPRDCGTDGFFVGALRLADR